MRCALPVVCHLLLLSFAVVAVVAAVVYWCWSLFAVCCPLFVAVCFCLLLCRCVLLLCDIACRALPVLFGGWWLLLLLVLCVVADNSC